MNSAIYKKIFDAHISLVESVNNARTLAEHMIADDRLTGFCQCCEIMMSRYMYGKMLMRADMHYMNLGIDRPMCCGVFLDWEAEHEC